MKKVLFTFVFAGMFAIYACGPSAADKAAEKAKQDSIADKATRDSINAAQAAIDAVRANTVVDTTK